MGYAGGKKESPTYHSLGDHTETIQIDYDPTLISYEELLDVFWESHSPTEPSWSRQYMSAVFFHNGEQKRLAMETREREAAKRGGKIFTEIISFNAFYLAEPYHQKYRLRQEQTMLKEYSVTYPNPNDFVNSTATARVNGFLDGYGTFEALQAEISGFGLSPEGSKKLLDIVHARNHLQKRWDLGVVS